MKAVIISVVGLLLALGAQAQETCPAVPQYDENIVPKCLANRQIWLPNYENVQTYYLCTSGTPKLTNCPTKTPYFSLVLQECNTCENYIPAVQCSSLTLGLECQPINGGATAAPPGSTATPTGSTAAPTGSTATPSGSTAAPGSTATPTTKTTKTTTSTTPAPVTPTTANTDGGASGTTEFVPQPPSPNEGPTPPGPDPTPPVNGGGPPIGV